MYNLNSQKSFEKIFFPPKSETDTTISYVCIDYCKEFYNIKMGEIHFINSEYLFLDL